jgi:hypothetical protein
MKTKKRVDKKNGSKDRPQGPARSKGGGRLDGRVATTNPKRNAKGSVRERTPA